VQIPGVGAGLADALFEKGYYSAEELAKAEVDDLVQIRGIGEEKARQLISNARNVEKAAQENAAELKSGRRAAARVPQDGQAQDGVANADSGDLAEMDDSATEEPSRK
jgi:transcription termination/antitermination protein NusA